MKKYIRSANKFTNKVTQLISKAYTEEGIRRRAAEGSHKGESMAQIYQNIIHDPDISFGPENKDGDQVILYKGHNIGWINFRIHKGWIDNEPYQELQKYVEPEPEESEEFEDYDDEFTEADY